MDGWGTIIKVKDLPKYFDDSAIDMLFRHATSIIMQDLTAATGIAYLADKTVVTGEQVKQAIAVKDEGLENLLGDEE